ncbi:MAG: beta strand repeat-containing protein, partial [Saprospiraceae bacterium]
MSATKQILPVQMRKATSLFSGLLPLFLFTALLLTSNVGWGQKTWDGSSGNNWNNDNNWTPAGVPGAGDAVIIPNGFTVNVNNPGGVCASLIIEGGATANTLSINANNALTVLGPITINPGTVSGVNKIIAVNNGTLSCSSITMGNTALGTIDSEITLSTGTLTVSGDITMNGDASRNAIRFSGAGTLNIGGAISGGDLESTVGSTVNYNGTAPQTVVMNNDYVYTNLAINNTAGAILGDTISAARVTETIAVGDITPGSVFNTNNLAVARGGADAIIVAAGSTLNAGTTSITWGSVAGTITINGTFQTANTAGFSGAAARAISSTNSPTITLGSSSTIEYNATGNQQVTQRSYNNLALSGSGNKTINGVLTTVIANNLSISGSAKARLMDGSTSSALSLTLGGVNKATGSWGSSGSAAANTDDTWFVIGTSGIININTGCTTGNWLGLFSTDWNDAGNWCGGIPTAATDAVIPNGFEVIVDTAAVCASLTISGGDTVNIITINSPNSLSVTGTIIINAGTGSGDNKVIAVNDGTLSCSSITMENTSAGDIDSEITITTGTLTVSGDITMNGSGNRNGVRIQDAGTLNIGGAITGVPGGTLDRAAGSTVNFNGTVPQIIPTGSAYDYDNVTINNTAGVSFQAATPVTNGIIAGKITVGNLVFGSVLNTNNVAVTRGAADTIIVMAGSRLNAGTTSITWNGAGGAAIINGTFSTADTLGFSGASGTPAINPANAPAIWLGANSTIEFNAPSPLVQIVSQRTDYANVTLSGGLKTMAAGTHTISRNFTINSGVIYNGVPNNPLLNIAGNLINSGSFFNQGNGRINLNGSTQQTIGGGTTAPYDTLVLNNPAGAQLSSPVYIGRQFIFTQGLLATTNTNVLIFNNNATASAIATAFVNGPVQKIGNTGFTFPTGKGTTYGPMSISAPTATATFRAEYFVGPPPSLVLGMGMGIAEITDEEYWDLTKISADPASVRVSLRWFGNAMAMASDITNLRVAHFTGGAWVSAGGTTTDMNPATGGMIMS